MLACIDLSATPFYLATAATRKAARSRGWSATSVSSTPSSAASSRSRACRWPTTRQGRTRPAGRTRSTSGCGSNITDEPAAAREDRASGRSLTRSTGTPRARCMTLAAQWKSASTRSRATAPAGALHPARDDRRLRQHRHRRRLLPEDQRRARRGRAPTTRRKASWSRRSSTATATSSRSSRTSPA